MTRPALEHAVASALGESLSTVRRLGFSLMTVSGQPPVTDFAAIRLALDCPFCGHAVDHPGTARCGSAALAECDRCDVYFEFDDDEVYVAPEATAVLAA